MPKRKSLQSSLAKVETRLKKKTEAERAAKATAKKEKAPAKKVFTPTFPFKATDKILLIGEGNFSFAYSLTVHPPTPELEHLPAENIVATAYDTEAECLEKYPDAEEKIVVLREKGIKVLFGVDATKLEKCSALKERRFDKVVWNFPHAGKGISDQDRNILSNQLVILGFLRSVAGFLTKGPVPSTLPSKRKQKKKAEKDDEMEDAVGADASVNINPPRGTVIITLRNVPPYTEWDVPKLAKKPPAASATGANAENLPYTLMRSFAFHRWAWKGYEHRMTKGEKGKTGEGGEDRSWEFYLAPRPYVAS